MKEKEKKELNIKKEEKKSDNIAIDENKSKKEEKITIEQKNDFVESEEKKIFNETEELPEDVKKKLEKSKKEKSKKRIYKKKKKKLEKKDSKIGKAYVKATYNNTIVTLTDLNGNVISWASAGVAGFKGPKKSTPYAAHIITKIAVMKAREESNLEEVSVFVKGVGTGRESAVRALNANGLIITSIKDITPVPHNGCRSRKPRSV